MHTHDVVLELARFTELRRRLLEIEPDLDEQTLFDTLEGSTDLREVIGCIVRSALDDEALLGGLKLRLDDMKDRMGRIAAAADRKRQLALTAMEEADIDKIVEPDFTITAKASPPAVVITNEPDIPESFWLPQPPKLDRRSILDALKSGQSVPGAELSNTRIILSVRTK
jgi:hypothetical protein